VAGKASNLVNYGKDGAFVDLGQRLGENTPNINQLFSAYPQAEQYVTANDGGIISDAQNRPGRRLSRQAKIIFAP
jgi:hypothetical protein